MTAALAVSEKDVDRVIGELADRFRWKAFHCGYPVRPIGQDKFVPEPRAKGFPDWLLLRGARMVVIETKKVGKKPRPEQEAWLDAFREFGVAVNNAAWTADQDWLAVEVLVVRPADLDSLAGVLR